MMTAEQIQAKVFGTTDSPEVEGQTPALEGVATTEPNGDIVVRFKTDSILKHVKATPKGAVGLSLAIPAFTVGFKRTDGTIAQRQFVPSWKGLWVTLK